MANVCANCGPIDSFVPVLDGSGEIVCGRCPAEALMGRLGVLGQDAAAAEDASIAEALAGLSGLGEAPQHGVSEAPPLAGAGAAPGGHPKGHYRNAATRSKRDFYETPAELVRAILKYIPDHVKVIWEPCWGGGAIAKELAKVKNENGSDRFIVIGSDLFAEAPQVKLDFLAETPTWSYDMIVTNSPWNDKPAWLNRFIGTGKPFLTLWPLSIMAGVATSAIFKQTPAKFFVANHHAKFEHEGKKTDVGDVVWIGHGLNAELPVLNWLDLGGVVRKGKGGSVSAKVLEERSEKLAVKLALEEQASLDADHNLAVTLALAEMTEAEPVLPYYTKLVQLLPERIMRQPPVVLTEGRRHVLELFAGTGSFSKAFLAEYPLGEAVRVELDPAFSPDHAVDILRWDYKVSL